jgi:hypothetical protein
MNLIATLGMAFGAAWTSGLNLYAMVATLGLLGRFTTLRLPGDLDVLTSWWVIGTAGALYLVEFVADKIPAVDSTWDLVHTFIRVPAGAIVAAAALGDFNPVVQAVAFLVGGGIALTSHGTKAATRAALNLNPEPATNVASSVVASLVEDVIAIAGTVLAVVLPVFMLILVAVAVGVSLWLLPKLYRILRRAWRSARDLFRGKRAPQT